MKQPLAAYAHRHLESGRARIPVFPSVAVRAQLLLSDPAMDLDEVEDLVASDPALAAALLRAANSAAFGAIEEVATIREAAIRLGVRRTCQLVIVFSQHKSYAMKTPVLRTLAGSLWKHATACALGSDWLAKRLGLAEIEPHAMLAGLLHDVGKLFLLDLIDDLGSGAEGVRFTREEVLDLLESLHCEQGERLLMAWGIPETYRNVARRHHDAQIEKDDPLLRVVRVVDRSCHRLGIGLSAGAFDEPDADAAELGASDVMLAELEIRLEDAARFAGS